MKYSIVIPTYNNKYHLVETLRALQNQIHHSTDSYEVIVVDDGSSDGLLDYISNFEFQLNLKINHLKRDNFSCRARARNIGWKNALGNYIVFIDSDILVKEDHLSQLDRYFDAKPDCVVIGNRLHMKDNFQPAKMGDKFSVNYDFPSENYSVLDYRYLVFSSQSYNSTLIPDVWLHAYSCNIAVAKEWLVKTDGFDEKFIDWGLEDVELGYRFHLLGLNISINPYIETFHQGAGHRDDIAISQQRIDKYKENIHYFLRKHPTALSAYLDPVNHLIDGQYFESFNVESNDVLFEFYDHLNLDEFKNNLLQNQSTEERRIVVFDFSKSSNLDVWIQSSSLPIYYFPMTRMIDVIKMQKFIDMERHKVKLSKPKNHNIIQLESALN